MIGGNPPDFNEEKHSYRTFPCRYHSSKNCTRKNCLPARTVPARTVPARTVPARTVPARTVPARTVPAEPSQDLERTVPYIRRRQRERWAALLYVRSDSRFAMLEAVSCSMLKFVSGSDM